MQLNSSRISPYLATHEGAPACNIPAEERLKRSVMTCMLWEKSFYEDGQSIADRISALVPLVAPESVYRIAVDARNKQHLRHVPLLLVVEMLKHPEHKKLVSRLIPQVVLRVDEMSELLSIYWKDGKKPLAAQLKKGLAECFSMFTEYQFSKYNRDKAVKLRDVMFLTHPHPRLLMGATEDVVGEYKFRPAPAHEALFKKIADNTLPTPDTWEVALSAGRDKKETWERLIAERKLGGLALLRNLRNMLDVNVDMNVIKTALAFMNTDRILPFRFIAAARHAPSLEPEIEKVMLSCLGDYKRLEGATTLLIDVSGSMNGALSSKSDLTRLDAACGLAILLREVCKDVRIFKFNHRLDEVPLRQGFSLRDAVGQAMGDTQLGSALHYLTLMALAQRRGHRIIVLTDEQSEDPVTKNPVWAKAYMINVATYANGVGYGKWTHINGFSESIVDYILEVES